MAIRRLSAAPLAMLLGGCAMMAAPAPNIYDIQAPAQIQGQLGSSSAQLAVTEPTAIEVLGSERIVVRPSATEISFLSRSQWGDRTPRLFQARLIEAFQNSGRIRSVNRPGGAVASNVGLVTDLRAFHIDVASNAAIIELTAQLVAEEDGRVIASRRFQAAAPVSEAGAAGMVSALNTAFASIAGEIVTWTLGRI